MLPELVGRGQDEAGMLSLNYTGLVPVLIKAAQEEHGRTEAQQARIGHLEAALDQRTAEIHGTARPTRGAR